jgi:Sulfotransferase family
MTERRLQDAPSGPDFLCVGAQKAGTGWLYEQLRDHPDFWMPPVKELHFFDRTTGSDEALPERSVPYARKNEERIDIARLRARDDRDRRFLDQFTILWARDAPDLNEYARLFESKGHLISGDITPGYSILPESRVAKIVSRFPTTSVIFLARDPVERAWSQLSMYIRRGLIARFDPNNLEQITQHLKRPEIFSRSCPSETVRRWQHHVSPDRFRVFFFDDLKRDPVHLRSSIITVLGGDPNKRSDVLPPDYNPKAEKQKLPLSESVRAHLARFFEDELRACAVELGGPAMEWPKRYGL